MAADAADPVQRIYWRFLDKVTEEINQKGNVDVIFLDFAKAFDNVLHRRLLAKLQAHGIDGLVLRWIESWLPCRLQRVCLDGHSSRWVLSGIPQGSVLGPLLFLIFVNDVDSSIKSILLKFAQTTPKYLRRSMTWLIDNGCRMI